MYRIKLKKKVNKPKTQQFDEFGIGLTNPQSARTQEYWLKQVNSNILDLHQDIKLLRDEILYLIETAKLRKR